ncbi:MAG: TolC family protein [Bacteroidetes bacterium]|nr:TolC family protein [Bacteroidota bacterium]
MCTCRIFLFGLATVLLCAPKTLAQQPLTLTGAIEKALANNLIIKIAQNQAIMAENSATRGNAGGLPGVSAGAAYNGSLTNTELIFAGNQPSINRTGAQSGTLSGNVTVSYALFNGFVAANTFDKLQLQEELAITQTQLQVESVVLQVINAYYLALQIQGNMQAATASLEISRQRLNRASTRAAFGSANQLAVLNAQVDLTNDSIDLMLLQQQLVNAKINLNYLMGNEEVEYNLDATVELNAVFDKAELLDRAMLQNAALTQARKNLEVSEKDMDIAKGSWYPGLSVSTGYNFSSNQSDASFIIENRSNGLSYGVSLSYNLFNGGRSSILRQNSEINWNSNLLRLEDAENALRTQIDNAYTSYQGNVAMHQVRIKSLDINQLNFERSEEMFKNGQISGTEFREAQMNLTNARVLAYLSQIQVKLSEYELLRLSGSLLSLE